MLALLPTSSSTTGIPAPAAACATVRPTGTDPMKLSLPTRRSVLSAAPTVVPAPTATESTPAGKPASSASCARRIVLSGVYSLGLRITALPAASGADEFHPAVNSGEFHGVTATTTPHGTRVV